MSMTYLIVMTRVCLNPIFLKKITAMESAL